MTTETDTTEEEELDLEPEVRYNFTPEQLRPNTDHIEIEDGRSVDNIFSEKQQRLLTEPLHTAWAGPDGSRAFVAMANVGVFIGLHEPPVVPDMFLSLYVRLPEDMTIKRNLTYFVWEYGKAPDLAIEIVSNRKGGELSYKLTDYIRVGVPFYVVFDPLNKWKRGTLSCFERQGGAFVPRDGAWFADVGLGLTLWEGTFEDAHATWLRWCDKDGHLIPTGAELAQQERARAEEAIARVEEAAARAEEERTRAEEAAARAEEERTRAEEATARAERLLAQLRAAGIEPDA